MTLLDYATTVVVSAATASEYIAGEVNLPFPTFVGTIIIVILPLIISLLGLKESARTAFGILAFHVRTSIQYISQVLSFTSNGLLDVNHVSFNIGGSGCLDSKWELDNT